MKNEKKQDWEQIRKYLATTKFHDFNHIVIYMTYTFEYPVTRGNKIKYNSGHFCMACHNLQIFSNTLVYNFIRGKKGYSKM